MRNMSRVNNKNTRTTLRSDIFIVNSEQISHLFLVFLLLTLSKQMLAGLKLFKRKKATVDQL